MNTLNKVFIGFIFVLLIAVLVLGSLELYIRGTGLKKLTSRNPNDRYESLIEKVEKADKDIAAVKDGASSKDSGLEDVRSQLTVQMTQRGRGWFNCVVADIPEAVQVKTLPPQPVEGADANSAKLKPLRQVDVALVITGPKSGTSTAVPEGLRGIVYAFQEGTDTNPGVFLGRFAVNSSPAPAKYNDGAGNEQDGYQVSLITVDSISETEIKTIENAASAKWSILLIPPKDAVETDPTKRRDFAVALDYAYNRRNKSNRQLDVLDSSIGVFNEATKKSNEENAKMTKDIELENKRVAAMEQNSEIVEKTLADYNKRIDEMSLQIEKMQVLQSAYLKIVADAQLQVKKKIEQDAQTAAGQ
ncbi:hypothetical protein FACS189419_03700 [Planctomycetales bacterium]|nr:hypothetical protein FACS189419_03700 [Planctomycetales bacterium]